MESFFFLDIDYMMSKSAIKDLASDSYLDSDCVLKEDALIVNNEKPVSLSK